MSVPELILQKIDHALTLKNAADLKDSVEEVIAELIELKSSNSADTEIHYLLGYCWYIHPERENNRQIEVRVERELQLAIKQEPDLPFAWLYLCHNAYDSNRYRLALERALKVNIDKISPYYRLKTLEICLCCKIHLNGLKGCLDDIAEFVETANQQEIQDVWPSELAKVITQYVHTIDQATTRKLESLLKRLDKVGQFGHWFGEVMEKAKENPR